MKIIKVNRKNKNKKRVREKHWEQKREWDKECGREILLERERGGREKE